MKVILALAAAATATTDVFLASDRAAASAAVLNSVCDNSDPAQLRIHLLETATPSSRRLKRRCLRVISAQADICASLFPNGQGSLACPKSKLEMELLRDVYWEPDQRERRRNKKFQSRPLDGVEVYFPTGANPG